MSLTVLAMTLLCIVMLQAVMTEEQETSMGPFTCTVVLKSKGISNLQYATEQGRVGWGMVAVLGIVPICSSA